MSEAIVDARDPYAAIGDTDVLKSALKRDLSYCPCGCDDAIPELRNFLAHVQRRTDAMRSDDATFRVAHKALDDLIVSYGNAAVSTWFVYLLEQAGILWHGKNLFDLTLSMKGASLLKAIERCAGPADADAR